VPHASRRSLNPVPGLCIECATGRPADARTTTTVRPTTLPDVPARIAAAKAAILGLLGELGRTTGVRRSRALSPELRQHFPPAVAELVGAGLVIATITRRGRTYELATRALLR
jgi:hypothetical protein